MVTVRSARGGRRAGFERWRAIVRRDAIMNRYAYLMALPMITYYILFCYMPMYGVVIAFQDFSPARGILGSTWVGLKHFRMFFNGAFFVRLLRNTLLINVINLAFGFPAPILLALLLNELRQARFKRVVQTVSYLPHFISVMVICGMIIDFTSSRGIVNDFIAFFGGERQTMLLNPAYFRSVYVVSEIWQGVGWGSIIYLSALAGIDAEQYEAAVIDGAGRFAQLVNITLPGIAPTIVIMLIMRIGQLMNVGYEKIILLYNGNTYDVADVISTFVYRKGLVEADYSYSTAVGLFNSVVNLALLLMANTISRKVSETSLW